MIYLTASKWEKVSLCCVILYRPTHQDFAWNKNIRWDAWIWCITVSFNWLVIEKEEHRKGCIPRAHCHVFSVPYDTVATSFNVNQLYENAELFFSPPLYDGICMATYFLIHCKESAGLDCRDMREASDIPALLTNISVLVFQCISWQLSWGLLMLKSFSIFLDDSYNY